MVTPDVHAVCVLHPADDDAARLARVDAAADRQARSRACCATCGALNCRADARCVRGAAGCPR